MENPEMIHKYVIPDWLKNITPIPKGTILNFLLGAGILGGQPFGTLTHTYKAVVAEESAPRSTTNWRYVEGHPILARGPVNYSIRVDNIGDVIGRTCNINIEFTDNKQSKINLTGSSERLAGERRRFMKNLQEPRFAATAALDARNLIRAERAEAEFVGLWTRSNKDILLFDTNQEWWLQLARLRLAFSKGLHERLGIDTHYNQFPDVIVNIIVGNLDIFVGHDREEPLKNYSKVIVVGGEMDPGEKPIFGHGLAGDGVRVDMDNLKIGVIEHHLALKSDGEYGVAADEGARRLALTEEVASELARPGVAGGGSEKFEQIFGILQKNDVDKTTSDKGLELSGKSQGGGKRKKTKRKKRKSYKKRPKKRKSKRKKSKRKKSKRKKIS